MLRNQNILFDIICGTTIKRMACIRYPRIKHYSKSEEIERENFNKNCCILYRLATQANRKRNH